MRALIEAKSFRKDYKKLARSGLRDMDELKAVVSKLEADIPLEKSYKEHRLTGDWEGCDECHIRPDWLLIYSREGDDILVLYRTGSHAELFD